MEVCFDPEKARLLSLPFQMTDVTSLFVNNRDYTVVPRKIGNALEQLSWQQAVSNGRFRPGFFDKLKMLFYAIL